MGFRSSPMFRLACSLCYGPFSFERAQLLISIPFSVYTLILFQLIEGSFILLTESVMRAGTATKSTKGNFHVVTYTLLNVA